VRSDLGLKVVYCNAGGLETEEQLSTLEPNSEWNLVDMCLGADEADIELHIYDEYQRELLTLRFKVNTVPVGSSEPSTMTLPDSDVIKLLIAHDLENDIEYLASSGIHTIEQIRNMTEEDRRNYGLSLTFRRVMDALKAKRQKIGGNQAGLQSMLSILETL
jgi:hypothetical protein